MNTNKKTAGLDIKAKLSATSKVLKNTEIDIKHKLSALWLVFMLLYIYTDFYTLYTPGKIQEMMSGVMDGGVGLIVTQVSLLVAAIAAIIPAFMIFLSLVVRAKANRWLNIILGILHIALGVYNLVGATWAYYIFYGISLTLIAILIVVYAWKWRNPEVQP
jgi:uncharacterized membrane protein HdeD (DUF308 family)